MKISILLPYKENYTINKAGAVSLFVRDTFGLSEYKKNTYIFGSTSSKKNLSENYINLNVRKNILKSSNLEYVKSFINNKEFKYTKILEIHNRPSYIRFIKDHYIEKILLYFHNDPLSMNGSKTLKERKFLIENVDMLIFNSVWSKNRFFIGFTNINIYNKKISVCYQSTNKVQIDFKKKKKIISFIGKLNSAKGYDIFGNSIIKVLDKHPHWKAYVFGDEKREQHFFKHKNLRILGFKNNKFILNFLKQNSISVICSRWEEPFGRSSLEAASRGCATIISNRGGLPETSKSAIILNKLNSDELYFKIDELIQNSKKLIKYQKLNYNNFYLTNEFVSSKLDAIRKNFLNFNNFIVQRKPLKILHVTNFNYRFDGRLQYNTGRRINNGFVRLGHNVLTVSDRDFVNQYKNITDLDGSKKLNDKLIRIYKNFKPDLLVLGHADAISNDTLFFFKNNGVKICQWFLDPLSKFGPDYHKNKKRIIIKHKIIDATFLTTNPSSLDFNINNSYFIPNPCDESFEFLENYNNDCKYDLFFAMSHGVHRGQLKKGKSDNREIFINELVKKNNDIIFDLYGLNNIQPIWGNDFINKISNSSMGLNLSRGEPVKYYSSDRIAQLMGNGLLTFIDEKTYYGDFFTSDEIVTYKNLDDLSSKLNKFKKDKKKRSIIAKNGKEKYFKYFNSTIVAEYIINKTLDNKIKNKLIWQK
jgi:glycosyltransferase involved in cell wall biosynthesis